MSFRATPCTQRSELRLSTNLIPSRMDTLLSRRCQLENTQTFARCLEDCASSNLSPVPSPSLGVAAAQPAWPSMQPHPAASFADYTVCVCNAMTHGGVRAGATVVPVRAKLSKLLAQICPGDINRWVCLI